MCRFSFTVISVEFLKEAEESPTENAPCNYSTPKGLSFPLIFLQGKKDALSILHIIQPEPNIACTMMWALICFALPIYYLNEHIWRRYKPKSSFENYLWIKLRDKRIHSIVIWAHRRNWVTMLTLSTKTMHFKGLASYKSFNKYIIIDRQ